MPKASIIYPSNIVDRNGNGGWHRNGKRAYRRAVSTIMQFLQTAKEPRLYHLCFEELESDEPRKSDKTPHETNMAMLNAFVQMAEREGIKLEWFGAREQADATKKDHLHVFMVIDAKGIKVAKLFNQFEDGRVQQFCNAHGVKFAIFAPKDIMGIHGRNVYMALPYQGPGNRETPLGRKRLADALVWLSYGYKARSKPTDDADGQIFPASRPNRKRKLFDSPAASPAALQPNESEQYETRTTEAPEANPIGCFPADQEGTHSSSYEALVGSGQRTSASEESWSQASSPSNERYGSEGAKTYHQGGGEELIIRFPFAKKQIRPLLYPAE
ncbi:hypothetical protein GPY61_14105 [Massilia sp. NEAU-DD11]|uniref:Uncharacterized protein n=1 Tax=Massilia cellulosiltytica TaxID=2683234 RepID=A0A7X3G120_9BURK|nr:hypothetical protein [Telluria cellulosilytica]MVW61064.1 hypothetical protein [Telluria cellulosilytica]